MFTSLKTKFTAIKNNPTVQLYKNVAVITVLEGRSKTAETIRTIGDKIDITLEQRRFCDKTKIDIENQRVEKQFNNLESELKKVGV